MLAEIFFLRLETQVCTASNEARGLVPQPVPVPVPASPQPTTNPVALELTPRISGAAATATLGGAAS
jgi:hypothetical protein